MNTITTNKTCLECKNQCKQSVSITIVKCLDYTPKVKKGDNKGDGSRALEQN